jgi:hypothetical protein
MDNSNYPDRKETRHYMTATKTAMSGLLVPFALLALAPQVKANLITNGDFSSVTPSLKTNGICTTDPAVYPYGSCSAEDWTGQYQIGDGRTSGIFGVSFGVPQPDPGGATDALILQTYLHEVTPTATQSIDFPTTGVYALSFYAANRSTPAGNNGPQTVSVLLDNSLLPGGTFSKLSGAWTKESLDFSATAGIHSLTLEGLISSTGDVSAFIDDVSLAPAVTTPEPSTFSLVALVLLMAFAGLTRKRRLGSPFRAEN